MKERASPSRAKRLAQLPPYLFAELDKKKQAAIKAGRDVIDLGVGDPDIPTPPCIVEALQAAAQRAETHRYPSYDGLPAFREAFAGWFEKRFAASLDPDTEVLVLIGSKEGLGHLPWALLDPGDRALVPDPAYPVYEAGTLLAGGRPHALPLLAENGYLPDLNGVKAAVADEVKVLYLNYPNNPTGAVADATFFRKAVAWAQKRAVVVCHDAAYTEIAFDGYRPPSLLSVAGAKEVGIEFHSLSKTFNMTGWRVGFAVGNSEVIRSLSEIKKTVDSGVFTAIQYAGIAALKRYDEIIEEVRKIYQIRRDILVDGLASVGWELMKPRATFYVWARVPTGQTSEQFSARMLETSSISVTPGVGFGTRGEGFVRFSLTTPQDRIEEAVERIRKAKYA